jgi:hypothetical protein
LSQHQVKEKALLPTHPRPSERSILAFSRKRLRRHVSGEDFQEGVVSNRNSAAGNQTPALRHLLHSKDVFLENRPFVEPAQKASSALRQSKVPEATVNVQWVKIMFDSWRHNRNSRKRIKANSTGQISNIKAKKPNAVEHKKGTAAQNHRTVK